MCLKHECLADSLLRLQQQELLKAFHIDFSKGAKHNLLVDVGALNELLDGDQPGSDLRIMLFGQVVLDQGGGGRSSPNLEVSCYQLEVTPVKEDFTNVFFFVELCMITGLGHMYGMCMNTATQVATAVLPGGTTPTTFYLAPGGFDKPASTIPCIAWMCKPVEVPDKSANASSTSTSTSSPPLLLVSTSESTVKFNLATLGLI